MPEVNLSHGANVPISVSHPFPRSQKTNKRNKIESNKFWRPITAYEQVDIKSPGPNRHSFFSGLAVISSNAFRLPCRQRVTFRVMQLPSYQKTA
jgi:hypothetical protein